MIPGLTIPVRIHSIPGNVDRAAMMNTRYMILLFAVVFIPACATSQRFDTSGIDVSITPQQAVAESAILKGTSVLWGGVVINASNLKDATQIEILAYPLSSTKKPLADKAPMTRFLARHEGYLETSEYAQGRLITVSGILQGSSMGKVGESEYTYPLVNVTQHHLWPKRRGPVETRFHFGIGVIISN